ncbi:MAG: NADH:flavin oxidoreductase [Thermodesulfobacteriota bacterium]
MEKQVNSGRRRIPGRGIDRREFIRLSSLAAMGAAAMPGMFGCAAYQPPQDCRSRITRTGAGFQRKPFEPAALGSVKARNRFIRSATTLGLALPNGRPSPELADVYTELCEGGVGAIITDAAAIRQSGKLGTPYCLVFEADDAVADFRILTERAHAHNTPILLQIAHGGRQTRRAYTGTAPVAPSPVADSYYNEETPRELTDLEIRQIISDFVAAIVRARKAGFDGVQLHGAHGYLLSGFLSPATNRRTDQWGGSTENRFRIVAEIFRSARKQVGDYPILIKMNAYDHQADGLRVEEAGRIAVLLQEAGCDAVEVSCGMACDGFSTIRVAEIPSEAVLAFSFQYKDKPYLVKQLLPLVAPLMVDRPEPLLNYNVCATADIKRQVSIPVITVGGIRQLRDIEGIIGGNMADFVAMGRPFIIEPDIVNRFRDESAAESSCINCGYCLLAIEQGATRCFHGEIS